MGAHYRRPQFLATPAEVEIVCPGRAIKEDRLRFFALGQRFGCGYFCSDSLKRQGKHPGSKSHTEDWFPLSPSSWQGAGYLCTGGVTWETVQQAPPLEGRQAGRTGGWESSGSYEAVKSQRQRKIVYWAPGVTSRLVYFLDFFSLFSCFFSVVFFFSSLYFS